MVKIQVGLKSCSFHRRIQWWNSFCPTRLLLARRAKNVSKISAQLWSPRGKLGLSSPRAHRKTSSLVTSRSAMREVTNDKVFFSLREMTKVKVFQWARGDEVRPRGDESTSFPRGDQSCALIFETFLALLARWRPVGQNEFHHWIRLWKLQILSLTCIFTTGSL